MRCIVINLPLARERREAIQCEFRKIGVDYELWSAVSRLDLNDGTRQLIDQETRWRRGMLPMDDATIACLLSHWAVLRSLVESADDMAAIFEDDARLHPDLPDILNALEGKANQFDVVRLQRRKTKLPYYPVFHLKLPESLRHRQQPLGGGGGGELPMAVVHPWPGAL